MKRFLLTLLVLAIAAPAMATVTISVVDNGDLTADIVVVADGDDADANGSLVAGIALDVSVDAGVIVDVFNYKTTGESVVGDPGYGIYLGTITFTGGDPEDIADTGTPVAPATAPDAPGQVGSSAIVLELGALYDQATPEAAPGLSTVLCTIALSEEANVTIAANATRGGVVLIGGASVTPVLGDPVLVAGCGTTTPCEDDPACAEYLAAGFSEEQMECWFNAYQGYGDIDNKTETFFKYRVFIDDLNGIVANWKKKIDDPTLNPCTDIDHASETFFKYRCFINDLNIVVANWKAKDADLDG